MGNRICCVMFTVGALAGQARAQEAGPAAFADAERRFGAGDKAGACAGYVEAVAHEAELEWRQAFLAATKLGLCELEAGKIVSARGLYRRAVEILAAHPEAQDNAARARRAAQVADDLSYRASRITVSVPSKLAGRSDLAVFLDGRRLGSNEWNKELELDGGTYVLAASAEGYERMTQRISLANERDIRTVEITLTPVRLDAPSGPADETEPTAVETTVRRSRVPAVVAVTAGAALIATAAWAEHVARDRYDAYAADPAHLDAMLDSARHARGTATALAITGGLGIAAGIALWFLWPEQATPRRSIALVPQLGATFASADLVVGF